MRLEFDLKFTKSRILDLSQLLPEKFRETPVMQDLIPELNVLIGNILESIEDMLSIVDPSAVRWEYLKHLGALIGVEFIDANPTIEDFLRKEIVNAIDWYKVKGTYEAMEIIGRLINYDVNLYDLYTNDYDTFIPKEWFIGEEDENPPGLDATYYKSPHFVYEVKLIDAVSASSTGETYWTANSFDNLLRYMEKVRPVNTVPRFSTVQEMDIGDITTSSTGEVIVVSGLNVIKWWLDFSETKQLTFDEDTAFSTPKYFDSFLEFDTYESTWMTRLDKFVFGTGNKGVDTDDRYSILNAPGFAISNNVYEGTITADDNIIDDIDNDRIGIKVTIPRSSGVVLTGLSELGIYEGSVLRVASLFPDVDKDALSEHSITLWITK